MKKIYLVAAVAAVILTGCKTTEANYRAAYEIAKEKQLRAEDDGSGAQLQQFAAPKETTIDGVKINMLTEPVSFVADCGTTRETIQKYNVVVGRFRQLFNAKQMRLRLINSGYENAAFVTSRDAGYYVITEGFSTPEAAAKGIQQVEADTTLSLRAPLPFVLRPAHLAR